MPCEAKSAMSAEGYDEQGAGNSLTLSSTSTMRPRMRC